MREDLITGAVFLVIFGAVALDFFINRKRQP